MFCTEENKCLLNNKIDLETARIVILFNEMSVKGFLKEIRKRDYNFVRQIILKFNIPSMEKVQSPYKLF